MFPRQHCGHWMDSRWVLVSKPGTFSHLFCDSQQVPEFLWRTQKPAGARLLMTCADSDGDCNRGRQTADTCSQENLFKMQYVLQLLCVSVHWDCCQDICAAAAAAAAASMGFYFPTCRMWVQNAASWKDAQAVRFRRGWHRNTKKTLPVFVWHFCSTPLCKYKSWCRHLCRHLQVK